MRKKQDKERVMTIRDVTRKNCLVSAISKKNQSKKQKRNRKKEKTRNYRND